ncbi:MAG: hypothetical protein HZB26_05245 [Candidatus Hydrogenedentes bacterium]|nr:hypothetical protein [Candidatus Hydrogenedentota bacterium]
MTLAKSFTKEEEARNLQRVLWFFARSQEDRMEECDGWDLAASLHPGWDLNDGGQAIRRTMKGT